MTLASVEIIEKTNLNTSKVTGKYERLTDYLEEQAKKAKIPKVPKVKKTPEQKAADQKIAAEKKAEKKASSPTEKPKRVKVTVNPDGTPKLQKYLAVGTDVKQFLAYMFGKYLEEVKATFENMTDLSTISLNTDQKVTGPAAQMVIDLNKSKYMCRCISESLDVNAAVFMLSVIESTWSEVTNDATLLGFTDNYLETQVEVHLKDKVDAHSMLTVKWFYHQFLRALSLITAKSLYYNHAPVNKCFIFGLCFSHDLHIDIISYVEMNLRKPTKKKGESDTESTVADTGNDADEFDELDDDEEEKEE